MTTGLLSSNQREFLRGLLHDEDTDITNNPDQYESNLRHGARQRIEKLRIDLKLLEACGHDDVVAEFYHEIDRIERLRRQLGVYGTPPTDEDVPTADADADPTEDDSDE